MASIMCEAQEEDWQDHGQIERQLHGAAEGRWEEPLARKWERTGRGMQLMLRWRRALTQRRQGGGEGSWLEAEGAQENARQEPGEP